MIGPLSYVGGKNRLANQIIPLLPPHTTYVEPFCGGAQVFFHKEPSPVEVLNDVDGDVVNFLRVVQAHPEELIRSMRYLVASRRWFDLLARTDPSTLTDVQRAARFLYLQKNAFGGLIVRRQFHVGVQQRPNFNPERLPAIIAEAHTRLQHVQLEARPYEEVLARFDRPSTVFYVDPPYWGPKLYRFNFAESDFHRLAERLGRLKGKFLLSLNDRPEVRAAFSRFAMRPVDIAYSAQQAAGRRYRELLISNYDASAAVPRDQSAAARGAR